MGRLIALLLLATPAAGQEPMTAAEFDAYTTGRTLTFDTPSGLHGVEQYMQNRRVLWSPAPGTCLEGKWYGEGREICFVYKGDPEHKCWEVFKTERGIRAEFMNRPGSSIIFEAVDNPAPLICDNMLS